MNWKVAGLIPGNELSLSDMLADPIVRAVMARDGVTKDDVEGLIASVRERSATRQTQEREPGRHVSGAIAVKC